MFYCLKSKIGNQRKIILLLILFAVSVVVPMKFHYHKKAQEDVYNSLWSTFDESILNNLHAVLFKRYNNYKRNRKAFLNETFIPALIMLIGVGLTRIRPKL